MSAASNYTEQNVINAAFRGVAYPVPTGTYVSLHTANPGEDGGSEVSTDDWPGYVRRKAEGITGVIGDGWDEPVDGLTRNSLQLSYPAMDGDEGTSVTVTHWAVYDAPTGGNMITYSSLQTPRTLQSGDVFVFAVGALTVTVA